MVITQSHMSSAASESDPTLPLYAGFGFGLGRSSGTKPTTSPVSPTYSSSPSSPSAEAVVLFFLPGAVLVPRPLPLLCPDAFLPVESPTSARAFPFPFAPVFLRFLTGSSSASSSTTLPVLPSDTAGLGEWLLLSFAFSLRNSETTCCNRLLDYACRLRGAYVPLPGATLKNSLRLPCLFIAAACDDSQ
jgi:hypothetical protein